MKRFRRVWPQVKIVFRGDSGFCRWRLLRWCDKNNVYYIIGRDLYEQLYCQRGNMENRIKEQQLDLFADRTSCHSFLANQFRLLLSSAAYVLLEGLRRVVFHLAEGYPLKQLFWLVVSRLRMPSLAPT